MFRIMQSRLGHYALLVGVTALLTLPGLGSMSLWDMDEGLNAEAAREMLESGNWVVPTFNYQPRTAKPALLYWLQAYAYDYLGVCEFAARLPSALAAATTVLLTYELGRRMFTPTIGLLAGVILITTVQVCVLAHAATPDAVLLACLTLTFWLFWVGAANGSRHWTWMIGLGCGLAMLAKGPIGLVMPAAVIGYYFLARRETRRLFDMRLFAGLGLLILVAGPWYIRVGAETHGAFIRGFWRTENVGRFLAAMEGHTGPAYYYLLTLFVGLAPWCIFLGPTLWDSLFIASPSAKPATGAFADSSITNDPQHRGKGSVNATTFLLSWSAVYLGFFSLAQTKLPNYVLPVFPPLALLTARFLDRWRRGVGSVARWVMPLSLFGLVVVGAITAIGELVAGGVLVPSALGQRAVTGLAPWAWLGLIPVLAAAGLAWCVRRDRRTGFVMGLAATAAAYVGALATFPTRVIDAQKAPRALVAAAGASQPGEEVRIATLAYFQPSLVYYCRREVSELANAEQAATFLRSPWPAYLFCPANLGEELAAASGGLLQIRSRHHDLLRGGDVVVVSNR
jgi:4-amino-4-deoxy-L-arabinose transferase-like glycosyltransferase